MLEEDDVIKRREHTKIEIRLNEIKNNTFENMIRKFSILGLVRVNPEQIF